MAEVVVHPHWWERQIRTKERLLQREAVEQRQHRRALGVLGTVGGGDASRPGWLERFSGLNPPMLLDAPVPPRLRLNALLLAAYVTGGAVFLNNGMMQVAEALYFANEFNASPQVVGVLFSLISLGTLLARYPAGLIVDRVGVPPVIVTGLVVSGLVSVALPFAETLLGAGLLGTLAAFFGVVAASTIHVLIAKGAPKEVRGRANSILGLLSSLGLLLGAPVGTRLYDLWPGGAFVASGASFLVAALANLLLFAWRTRSDQPRQTASGK